MADYKKEEHELVYSLLKSTASWLENPDNEVYSLLEEHDTSLSVAAKALTLASAIIKKAVLDIQIVSGVEDNNTPENKVVEAIDKLRQLADELDENNMTKKANVLDEILLTLTSSVEEQEKFKKDFAEKILNIKNKKGVPSVIKSAKEDEDTSKKKDKKKITPSLSTRYCPDCKAFGMLTRVSDGIYSCDVCSKEFDYNSGFTTIKGEKVEGRSVSNQSQMDATIPNVIQVKK